MIEITSEYLREQGLSETFPARFWKRVRKSESCWIWTGCLNSNGYGTIGASHIRPAPSRTILAHRASWILTVGPIPDGLHVCHKCDVPACVKPNHLFTGTDADNCADKRAKGREWHPCGEQCGNRKYTNEFVLELRRLHSDGFTGMQIVQMLNLPRSTVFNILKRNTWKHI